MVDLEVTRTTRDRRLYELAGAGTLRLQGVLSRSATAEAGGTTWQIMRRGLWRRGVTATDVLGTVVGEFEPRSLRRGGTLRWAGKRPVRITLDDPGAVEPGLLLFAAFVVRGLAEDAGSAAAAGASTAATGG